MDFKVIFKDSFIEDLEDIVLRIASENPSAGRILGELILQYCESLSFFPERYPKVKQRPILRRFIVKKRYKIFYRVNPPEWNGRNLALLGRIP